MSWQIDVPSGTSLILDIPSIHVGNWQAFSNWMAVEHYDFVSGEVLQGRHVPG